MHQNLKVSITIQGGEDEEDEGEDDGSTKLLVV